MTLNLYLWIKALHIISLISWMAGMFYLPRLYVYHTRAVIGSDSDKMLQIMERKLIRIIINPAMILTFIFGIWLITMDKTVLQMGWLHAKIFLVFVMTGLHGFFSKCRRDFANGKNRHSEKFYRILNEVPVLLMVIIVLLVVIKPF